MNRQEILNFAVTFLAKQGKQSIWNGSCRYKTIDNNEMLACGAGCFFYHEGYDPAMEGGSIMALMDIVLGTEPYACTGTDRTVNKNDLPNFSAWLEQNMWFATNRSLIEEIQSTHDNPYTWLSFKNFEQMFSRIADSENLDTDIFKTVTHFGA